MTDSVGISTAVGLHNDIFRRNAEIIDGPFTWIGGNTFLIAPDGQDTPIDLPSASDWPNEEIFFKRTDNSAFTAQLITDGSDTFDGESGFDIFTMAFKGEWVKIKSDGVSSWLIIERKTFCAGAMGISSDTSFNVTSTPTKINIFTGVRISTKERCEVDLTAQQIQIKEIQNDNGDLYDVRFGGTFDYANNSNLKIQLYCNGVAIPELLLSDQGQGPNDDNSPSMAMLHLFTEPCNLELRISGSTTQATPIKSIIFGVIRQGG